jgi:hypothetical protein
MNEVSGEFLTGFALACFIFGYVMGFAVAWKIKSEKVKP